MSGKTLIAIVLDASGSMAPQMTDTIGGFNQFIGQQRAVATEDKAVVYLVTFNNSVAVGLRAVPLATVPALTSAIYRPGGGTALYDAVADTIALVDKDKEPEDRVVFVIMTDGEENASRRANQQLVRQLVADREAKGDWTFVYIGEQPERWAQGVGMSAHSSVPYNQHNSADNYMRVNSAVSRLRSSNHRSIRDVFLPD